MSSLGTDLIPLLAKADDHKSKYMALMAKYHEDCKDFRFIEAEATRAALEEQLAEYLDCIGLAHRRLEKDN